MFYKMLIYNFFSGMMKLVGPYADHTEAVIVS